MPLDQRRSIGGTPVFGSSLTDLRALWPEDFAWRTCTPAHGTAMRVDPFRVCVSVVQRASNVWVETSRAIVLPRLPCGMHGIVMDDLIRGGRCW
jgi:hypothetical protein